MIEPCLVLVAAKGGDVGFCERCPMRKGGTRLREVRLGRLVGPKNGMTEYLTLYWIFEQTAEALYAHEKYEKNSIHERQLNIYLHH